MQIYNPNKSKINLNGTDYVADENGIIDVPDEQINSSVWTQGFVCAKGRLAELAKSAIEPVAMPEPEPVAMPEPEPVAMPEPEPVAMPEPEPVAMPVKKEKAAVLPAKTADAVTNKPV